MANVEKNGEDKKAKLGGGIEGREREREVLGTVHPDVTFNTHRSNFSTSQGEK